MDEFYSRAIPAPLDVDDEAGTAEGIIVPWDKEAPIVERQGQRIVHYTEVCRRGSAERAVKGGPGRLVLTYGHSENFGDRLGVATHVEDRADGLWGRFRFDASKREAARDAVSSSHQGLSMAFLSLVPKAFTEREGSLVERRSIMVLHVACVPEPAYAGAGLTVVRNLAAELAAMGDETAVEVSVRQESERRAAILAEAEALVAAGDRWASFRADGA